MKEGRRKKGRKKDKGKKIKEKELYKDFVSELGKGGRKKKPFSGEHQGLDSKHLSKCRHFAVPEWFAYERNLYLIPSN